MGTVYNRSSGKKAKITLVGTYSTNASIDVSAYKPKAVSQFKMNVTGVSYNGGVDSVGSDKAGMALGHFSGSGSPSMTLTGTTLQLNGITGSRSYTTTIKNEWGNNANKNFSGGYTLTVQIYFIG